MIDEELQRLIEEGRTDFFEAESTKVEEYKRLFEHLGRCKSPVTLSEDFSGRVVRMVEQKQAMAGRSEYLWLSLGALLFLIAMLITIALTGAKVFAGIEPFKWYILSAAGVIITIQWIERKWIKPLVHKELFKR